MALLDPDASGIGHGELGLRSGLRTLDTLTKESESQKHGYIELRGSKILSGWALYSGSIYSILVDEVHDGRRLDVVGFRTQSETLTRVEARVDVVAGTWFFDADDPAASYLFVQLTDSSSPGAAATRTLAQFGWYFGTNRCVQPTLGADKLVDGGLEIWSSATALTNYSIAGSSGVSGGSVNRDSTIVAEGTYSARLEGTVVPGGFLPLYPSATPATVAGARYRWSGLYLTDAANPESMVAQLRVYTGTANITEDGRTVTVGSGAMTLSNTGGEWRRFCFDFRADTSTSLPLMLLSSLTSTGFGRVWWDGLKLQRIYRFEDYQARLSDESSLPSVSEGRSSIFFGGWETGEGALAIGNSGGYFEKLFAAYEFTSGDVYQRLGGRFPNGGNEILIEDQMLRRWTAQRPGPVTPSVAQLNLFDPRRILSETLPRRTQSVDVYPNLAASDVGRPRSLLFGLATNISPALIDNTLPVSYPLTYEVADGVSGVNGLHGAATDVHVYSYLDTQAADRQDSGNRVELVNTGAGIEFAYDFATGQFLVGNALPMRVTTENNKLDFNIGGGALVATIPVGLYVAGLDDGTDHKGLCKAIVTAMNTAAAVADMRCVFDMATKKFTISKVAGVLNLLCSTGVTKAASLWKLIGFNEVADRTGALTYLGDNETYTTPEAVILRSDAHGFKDDAGATYTGTANALIELGGDVMYFLLRHVLGVAAANIDVPSFVACRSGAASVRVCIGSLSEAQSTVGDIVARLETSLGADLLFNGDKFILRRRDNTTPTGILEIGDRDLLVDPEGWYDADDLASVFVVGAALDPTISRARNGVLDSTNGNASIQAWCLDARARLGREVPKDFSTYLWDITGTPVNEIVRNGTYPRRRFKLIVKSTALRKIPGDKILLKASNFLGRTDAAPTVVCRILSHDYNPHTWESTLIVAEVLTGVSNGW